MRGGSGVVRGFAVGAAALLVGALGVTGARAETPSPSPSFVKADADPVDVRVGIGFPKGDVAPGSRVFLTVKADILSGAPAKLSVVFRMPAGLEYFSDLSDHDETKECANSADKRTVTCTSQHTPAKALSYRLQMIVGDDVKPGTDLPVTATASTGDEPDAHPADNTASTVVQVRTGADFGVKWYATKTSVKPGDTVTTKLVVTNHSDRTSRGPGGATMSVLGGYLFWPYESPPLPCWADNYVWICEWEAGFAPGESRTFVFKWRFPKESAGHTVRVPASTLFRDHDDPVPGNDTDELVFKVAKASGGPKPTPTPTSTPEPTPSVSESASASAPPPTPLPSANGGEGNLAATGAGVGPGVLGVAVGLVVLGGGMFVLVQVRRRGR
ncbi:COG1361 family protein [Streptomyces sp. S6]